MAGPILLRVLVFPDPHIDDTWVAQALEHDIAAYGKSVKQAKLAFERTVDGHMRLAERLNREPFAALQPAPRLFWDIWQSVAEQKTVAARPIPHGHMLSVVSHDPVQTAH